MKVFLKLDKADQDKLSKQSTAMEAARALVDKSMGDFGGGQMRQEQQAAVMHLYRLTAEVKVRASLTSSGQRLIRIGSCDGQYFEIMMIELQGLFKS